ncbi:lytic transglycosylase, catalytic (plasmid) [Sphingobium sp. TKS]|nr:lytic transglycosylase, catalytic [Sphingobium sp. TKS]
MLIWPGCAQAGAGEPSHKVELIQMAGRSARLPVEAGERDGSADAFHDSIDPVSRFRIHGLCRAPRKWQEARATGWPCGRAIEREGRDHSSQSHEIAAMPIPGWMQPGGFQADISLPDCAPAAYRPAGFLSAAAEERRAAHFDAMHAMACKFGIPVGLFDALIMQESAYRPRAVSPKNAFGLAQLMPQTAAELGVDRYDVVQNLLGGAKYLRAQLDRFGHYPLALAAYNAGPGRIRNAEMPPIAETRRYVADILANWNRLEGLVSRPAPLAGPARSPAREPASRRANIMIF